MKKDRPKLIGLAGKAGSGKDTVAGMLKVYGYKPYAFAGPLKEALAVLGIPEPSRADKENLLPGKAYSYRKAAQTLGTEWARALDTDFWLNLAQRKTAAIAFTSVSDVRFPNEATWVRANGGVVWHLKGRDTTIVGAQAKHISEASLSIEPGDSIINNSEGIPELEAIVKRLMGKYR